MHIGLTGREGRISAAARAGLAGLALMATLALGACTTVEGTNALTDFGTFEREVMNDTARGVGLIPGNAPKEDLTAARAPLVLPRNGNNLPAPSAQVAAAQLPADSSTVRIDTSNLSEADLQRLRSARVVDLRSLSGRPLTPEEARALTARMSSAGMQVSSAASRPLYLPPGEYFTRVGDANLVCRAPNGELVPISDARCPDEVRRALRSQGPSSNQLSTSADPRLTNSETSLR
ncbi:hypothetical protein SAMN05216456_2476 [Devosia crocina]|uniref:Pilus assembly protein CpaD n=1 Tax=Devosia crocina TaxID=429728 RepID=A0A1I7NP54_9HYPH|nr:hypothetical protein [Devosia crocina]SFV36431.1 hypothetical protein SAMN05216456_2476 [Devosia crocina]